MAGWMYQDNKDRGRIIILSFALWGMMMSVIALASFSNAAQAQAVHDTPPSLEQLQGIKRERTNYGDDESLALDIRNDAIREAAISYGARGGLARRTFEIRQELEKRSRYMESVFNFRELLIPAPSGLMIEPPVVTENMNAMIIEAGGQQAAVSDRIYNIIRNVRIVSAPRTWRSYLERDWGVVEPPPDILRPQNSEERRLWMELVAKGWAEGYAQADEIFQEDLARLTADFNGMVRYRMLLTQNMISQPYALLVDRGVTGGGNEMRIGDRAVQITGTPSLISEGQRWQPASR